PPVAIPLEAPRQQRRRDRDDAVSPAKHVAVGLAEVKDALLQLADDRDGHVPDPNRLADRVAGGEKGVHDLGSDDRDAGRGVEIVTREVPSAPDLIAFGREKIPADAAEVAFLIGPEGPDAGPRALL